MTEGLLNDMPPPTPRDRSVVCAQVGRVVRGEWRIAVSCRYGYPQVILTPPLLEGGTPFPTVLWLTCPFLTERTSALESEGEVATWAARLSENGELAARMSDSDARYRALRAGAALPGGDPCVEVGIAGQADPLATKCIHAHVASYLGGLDDPVGESVVGRIGRECEDGRCDSLDCQSEERP